jgi:hypothetical protein
MPVYTAVTLIVFALVPACPCAAAPEAPGPALWPTWGYNVQHTGRSTSIGPVTSTVFAAWTFSSSPPGNDFDSSPAVGPDGTVYIGRCRRAQSPLVCFPFQVCIVESCMCCVAQLRQPYVRFGRCNGCRQVEVRDGKLRLFLTRYRGRWHRVLRQVCDTLVMTQQHH